MNKQGPKMDAVQRLATHEELAVRASRAVQGCADDLKRRTDACLDKLTETISDEL